MADEIERRWLVAPRSVYWPDDLPYDDFTIIQQVLHHPEAEVMERIRYRRPMLGTPDTAEHTHTIKRPTETMIRRLEDERVITSDEADTLSKRADPDSRQIDKTRRVFVWEGRKWELDILLAPVALCILEVELEPGQEDEKVVPPSWLGIIREVTHEPGWSNAEIAHKDWTPPDRLIPGPWLDRLVWAELHWRQEVPDNVPMYSADLFQIEQVLRDQFLQGEAIAIHQTITGKWVAHSSRFFYENDPDKRHYDDTAFRLSAWGVTLAHAVSVLVVVNGVNEVEEDEWYRKWAWDFGNGDEPDTIKQDFERR